MQKTATSYTEIIEALQQDDVRYSLLRDHDLDSPDLDELDLLIWPSSRESFERTMVRLDFRMRNDAPGKAVYANFSGGRLLLLDVHFALIQNGLEYLTLDNLHERLHQSPEGYAILPPEEHLLHLFFHNLIGKKRLQEKHLKMVQECLSSELDESYLQSRLASPVLWAQLQAFTENPEKYVRDTDLAGQMAKKVIALLHKRGADHISKNAKPVTTHKRGVHFAFIGVDGAGKSTTVETVQRHLEQAGKIKHQFVYMGPWGHICSPILKKVYQLKLFPPKQDWGALIRQKLAGKPVKYSFVMMLPKWMSGTIKGWCYYAGVYLEMWYRYFRDVRPNLRKGRVVLSDRYIYDLKYIYKKRPMSAFRLWRWFVSRFFPVPDRVVFIWNTPEDIISRKPQLGAEEITLFQEYYRKTLADKPLIALRSDQSPDAMAEKIVAEIMAIYLNKA